MSTIKPVLGMVAAENLHLEQLDVKTTFETPHKLATASLNTMPHVILVFLLYLPLSTNPNHSVIFDLDFHFLLVEPRRSAFNTCASGVSFQSIRMLTKAEFSLEIWVGKSLSGSHTFRENGSKILLHLPPKKLGIIDIFELCCCCE